MEMIDKGDVHLTSETSEIAPGVFAARITLVGFLTKKEAEEASDWVHDMVEKAINASKEPLH